ncbi:MAG TPA: DUF4097 family beta strand repeat-containing protein [Spirochaetia bacterium]|nr:DUF4097 family beta strand repeat-containing protein [Spirochaetia bacterium]
MNDERAMILKMLQDGKISIDEANALLDVLNEPADDLGAGFAKAGDAPLSDSRRASEPPPSGSRVFKEPSEGDRREKRPGGDDDDPLGGIGIDIDLSGLKESLRATMGSVRETMKGVSDSLGKAFSGAADFDFAGEFGRAMGRVRAEDEREIHATAGTTGSLRIENTWGDVRVTGVAGDAITGSARVACWASDPESAQEALRETTVELVEREGVWVLETRLGSERGTRIDVELNVPQAFAVTVSTASGDLWLENLTGSQNVKTMSGDVNVANLGSGAGDRQLVSTKSGDVIAASLSGDVTLSSLSGDVVVNGFSGVLRVTSQSGDVRVTDGRGALQLKTMSGDVHAELVDLAEAGDEPIRLASVSGEAVLLVPENAALDVDAHSTTGDARVSLEIEATKRGEHRVSGAANGGGVSVDVSSVSGDVKVAPLA